MDKILKDKLNELTEGYDISDRGYITSAGKFECEHVSALYFYEIYAEGGNYIEAVIQPSGVEMQYFELTDESREMFPEHLADAELVRCWESENGFFYLQKTTREEMEEHVREASDSVEHDEDYRIARGY